MGRICSVFQIPNCGQKNKEPDPLFYYGPVEQKEVISILRSLTPNTTRQEKQLILFMDEFPLFDKTS